MGLGLDRRSGGGGGGGVGLDAVTADNSISQAQVLQEMKYRQRVDLLMTQVPALAADATKLTSIASMPIDDEAMMTAALDAVGTAQIELMAKDFKELESDQQVNVWGQMSSTKQAALQDYGVNGPVKKKEGWVDKVTAPYRWQMKKGKEYGAKALGYAQSMPVIGWGLRAMEWGAEETSRATRIGPEMDSRRLLQETTGLDEQQLMERTGISTANAAQGPLPQTMGPLAGVGMLTNPSNVVRAARLWNEIGHSGEDDFLAMTQYRVFENLDEEYQGQGKDMLRWAKAVASGRSADDIAEAEGLSGPEAESFKMQLHGMQYEKAFRQAVSDLTGGKISAGRTIARILYQDMDMNTDAGGARVISGASDAFFQIVMDPTMVGGKLSKANKLATWAVKGAEGTAQISRSQHLAKLASYLDNVPGQIDDAAVKAALSHMPAGQSYWMHRAVKGREGALLEEAKAVYRPAKDVSEALKTGDFRTLVYHNPGFESAIHDIQKYEAALEAAKRVDPTVRTIKEDPAQLFEFYRHVTGERSIISTLDPNFRLDIGSMQMFGHGDAVIPHITNAQRAKIASKDWFRKVLLDDSDRTVAQLKANAAARAASKADLTAVVQESGETGDDLARALDDDWNWIPEDGLVKQKWRTIPKQIATVLVTPTTRKSFVPLLHSAEDLREFRALNETMGALSGMPRTLLDKRYNLFAQGNIAQRHAMRIQMFIDMSNATKLTDTAEGRAIVEKMVDAKNQAYGVAERLTRAGDDEARDLIIKQAIYEGQLAEGIAVPSARDMVIASRHMNKFRWVTGTMRNSVVESAMVKIWKPGQLLRLGFPLRAGADEALQYVGRVGSLRYVRSAVLGRWAGMVDENGVLLRDAMGHVIQAPTGAVNPMRTFTRALSNIAGSTDDVLRERAMVAARQDLRWGSSNALQREAILAPHMADAKKALSIVPKSMRWVDDGANWLATNASKFFHEKALLKNVSRADLARWTMRQFDDWEAHMEAGRALMATPFGQHAMAETHGASFNGLHPGAGRKPEFVRMVETYDPSSKTNIAWVPMAMDTSNYQWVSRNQDLAGFYMAMNHHLESMASSPTTRSMIDAFNHRLSEEDVTAVAKHFGGTTDEIGVDMVREVREALDDFANEHGYSIEQLASLWHNGASDETVEGFLKRVGLTEEQFYKHPAIPQFVDDWLEMPPLVRDTLTSKRIRAEMLTDDLELVSDRAVNAAYNHLRSPEGSRSIGSLVRAQSVGGLPVGEPVPLNHTRVLVPMLDRRSAEALVNLFSDPAQAETFAAAFYPRLAQILSPDNLGGAMKEIWSAFPPDDLASWAAGLKASLITSNSSYIPGAMAATTNPQLAAAMRDALQEVLPEEMLKPTLGYIDNHDDAFTPGFGFQREGRFVYKIDPSVAVKATPLDPNNTVRMFDVEVDGRRMWLAESEIPKFVGLDARLGNRKVQTRNKMPRLTSVRNGKIIVNERAIIHDYNEGGLFLRGQGGAIATERNIYGWTFPSDAKDAETLTELLTELNVIDGEDILDIDHLIGIVKGRNFQGGEIPYRALLEDNGLDDDLLRLADTATVKDVSIDDMGFDERAAEQSVIVKAALDKLGVDVDALMGSLKKKQYREVIARREIIHDQLRPAGMRPPRAASAEAVEREAEVMATVLDSMGLKKLMDPEYANKPRAILERGKNKDKKGGYRIHGEILASGATEDAAVRRTAQDMLTEVKSMIIGKENGNVLRDVTMPLRNGTHQARNLWEKVSINELPTETFAPMPIVAKDFTFEKIMGRFFRGTTEPIIGAMSRTPMMLENMTSALRELGAIRENITHKGLQADAEGMIRALGGNAEDLRWVNEHVWERVHTQRNFEEAGDELLRYSKAVRDGDTAAATEALGEIIGQKLPVTLSPDQMKLLKAYHANQSDAYTTLVKRASLRAMDTTSAFVDDHRIRSLFQEILGPAILPFWYAEEQFLRRFARGMIETPHMLRKGQLLMNGLRSAGFIRPDPNGQGEIFVLTGSELLTGVVADVAEWVTGNPAWQVIHEPLTMKTSYVLPGWNTDQSRLGFGPLIGVATEYAARHNPEFGDNRGFLFPGDRERKYWEYILPGPAQGLYKAFVNDPDPTNLVSAQMSAIAYMFASGHGIDADASPSEKQEFLDQVAQVTRAVGMARFISGQLSFTPVTPLDQNAFLRKEFTDLLAQGLPFEEALAVFMEDRNPEEIVHTMFKTTNEVGAPIPSTQASLDFMRDNEGLLVDYAEGAVWLMPEQDSEDKFDRRAYQQSLKLELRKKRTPEEQLDAVLNKEASEDYYNRRDEYERARRALKQEKAPQAALNQLDEEWSVWSKTYLNQHPVFAESFSNDASQRRQKALEQLRWMTDPNTEMTKDFEQAKVLSPLVSRYWQFRYDWDHLSDQSSKAAKKVKERITEEFLTDAWLYTQENPRAMAFYTSVIKPELPNSAQDMEARLTENRQVA